MNQEKFLKEIQFELLAQLTPQTKAEWGIMTPQHMVEHLSSLFLFTIEKIKGQSFYEADKLQRNYDYLVRDKQPLARNIQLKSMPTLPDLRFASIEEATTKLEEMVALFYAFFAANPDKKTNHPSCGLLTFEEWEYMHCVHARHHLLQFGLLDEI